MPQGMDSGELTAIVADNNGKFLLSFAAELVPGDAPEAGNDAPEAGNDIPEAGGNDAGRADDGGFSGPGHGAVDFGSGAEPQLKLFLPMGQSLAVITASLRKRKQEGGGFAGGAHGSVDFGSGNSGEPLTIEFPVSLIFSDQ